MNDPTPAAGWHGKLPTLGDFATRRLDPSFVQAWDQWLSAGLAALQQRDGWLDAYLASPSWRFLLMPGVMPGASPWAGVLMPSVDRVGRYFPLTIAQALPALPGSGDDVDALWSWLQRVDEAAVDALEEDWDIATLENELARIGPAPVPRRPAAQMPALSGAGPVWSLPLASHRHAGALIAAQAAAGWPQRALGLAWWHAQSDVDAPRLLCSQGLDAAALLPRLLGGAA